MECHPEVVDGLVKATEEAAPIISRVLQQQAKYQQQLQQAMAAMQGACAAMPDGSSVAACQSLVMASQGSQNASAGARAAGAGAGVGVGGKAAGGASGSKAAAAAASATQGPPVLVSGAGHDAMMMAQATKMGMLFVRCKDGISHSPMEHVDEEDVSASVVALYKYLQQTLG